MTTTKPSPIFAKTTLERAAEQLDGSALAAKAHTPFGGAAAVQRILGQAGGTTLAGSFGGAAAVQRILEQVGGTLLKDPSLVQAKDVEEIANKLREAADEQTVVAIDAAYSQVIDADTAEGDGVSDLALTLPFHDRYVRATLQLVAVTAYMSVAYIVGLTAAFLPPLSAALWMSGYTPNPKLVWRATGEAWARILSPENNHFPPEPPEKNIW